MQVLSVLINCTDWEKMNGCHQQELQWEVHESGAGKPSMCQNCHMLRLLEHDYDMAKTV